MNILNKLNTVKNELENKNFYRFADQTNDIMVKIAQSKTDLITQWNAMGDNFMKKDPNFIKPRKAPGAINTYADATSKSVTEYLNSKNKKIKSSEFTPYQDLATRIDRAL
jgi:phosphoribulokinase